MKKICLQLIYTFVFTTSLLAQNWQEVGTDTNALNANHVIVALCSDGPEALYAAGEFTDTSGNFYVAKWNGTYWERVGIGINALNANGTIDAVCTDAAHNLYAAGAFTDGGDKFYVAKWDGTAWSELGTGSNALNANAPIDAICVDASGNIYAAGEFTDCTSDTCGYEYVAKWDGATWSMLGTGSNALNANDWIKKLISDTSGNIYAAGSFHDSGYCYVAKWNGANWNKVGAGANKLYANGSIWGLDIDKYGIVYAGGFFVNADGHNYVAKWDGTTWSELGGSDALDANGAIYNISSDPYGNIFAAGTFFDTNIKCYVMKWDGVVWRELGTGTNALNANGPIFTMCTDNVDNVYAGGDFTDSLPSYGHRYVARYNDYSTIIVNVSDADNVGVYPNPATDIVYISVSSKLIERCYSLTDIMGNIMRTGKIQQGKTPIDLSSMPAGTYFLHIIVPWFTEKSIKIIKI